MSHKAGTRDLEFVAWWARYSDSRMWNRSWVTLDESMSHAVAWFYGE